MHVLYLRLPCNFALHVCIHCIHVCSVHAHSHIIFPFFVPYSPFLCRYEHVVFVLDALIYTLTHWPKSARIRTDQSQPSNRTTSSHGQSTNQETSLTGRGIAERFFERSESIVASSGTSESDCDPEIKKSNQKFFGPTATLLKSPDLVGNSNLFAGGQGGENTFSRPLSEAFPLAQQPHLLKPHAKKEHLFSSPSMGVGGGGGGGEGEGEERREGGKRLDRVYLCPMKLMKESEQWVIVLHMHLSVSHMINQASRRLNKAKQINSTCLRQPFFQRKLGCLRWDSNP